MAVPFKKKKVDFFQQLLPIWCRRGHEWSSQPFQGERNVWAGVGAFGGSTLGARLVLQTGVWLLLHMQLGGARTLKQELGVTKRVSLGGFKLNENSLKLVN